MKRIFPFFFMIIALTRCGSSSSSGTSGYVLQPNEATTFTTGLTSYTVNTGSAKTGTYAVIFNNTVNGTDYVGIGISSDPSSTAAFTMRIYFPSSTIPASVTLNPSNCTFYYRESGSTVTLNDTVTLNISGPDGNGVYTITTNPALDSIAMSSGTLTITSINALLVSSSLTSSD
jgi:hypothetical protein